MDQGTIFDQQPVGFGIEQKSGAILGEHTQGVFAGNNSGGFAE